MAYNKDFLKNYLSKKGDLGWITHSGGGTYSTLQYELLLDFIDSYLPPEKGLVLDMGFELGNFSIKIAQKNRRIIVGDLSEEQLSITRKKFTQYKINSKIEQFALLDELYDLKLFKNNYFDMTLCLSSTLSFACEYRQKMLTELVRVTKPGAPLIFTVRTKTRFFKNIVKNREIEKLVEATKAGLWEIIDTGYKQHEEFPDEPPYYAFSSKEIVNLLFDNLCEVLEIAALAPISANFEDQLTKIRENDEAWNNLKRIERLLGSSTGLVEAADEILIIARKRII